MIFVIITFSIFFILAFPKFTIGVLFYFGMYVVLGSFSNHFKKWYIYGTTIIGALGYHALSVLSKEYKIAKWVFDSLQGIIMGTSVKNILGFFFARYYVTGIFLLFLDLFLLGVATLIMSLFWRDNRTNKKNNNRNNKNQKYKVKKQEKQKSFDELLKETHIYAIEK